MKSYSPCTLGEEEKGKRDRFFGLKERLMGFQFRDWVLSLRILFNWFNRSNWIAFNSVKDLTSKNKKKSCIIVCVGCNRICGSIIHTDQIMQLIHIMEVLGSFFNVMVTCISLCGCISDRGHINLVFQHWESKAFGPRNLGSEYHGQRLN